MFRTLQTVFRPLAFAAVFLWPALASAQFRYPPFLHYRLAPPESALRIAGAPSDAEVYVDGYYAGTVDEFDGVFQRLHVIPGEHEISIYLEGYRTHREKLYLSPRSSRTIQVALEKLAPGEAADGPPAPVTPPTGAQPPLTRRAPRSRGLPPAPGASAQVGALTIQVRPDDAEILIDGELWSAVPGEGRLPVQLSEGTHRIEVRKVGYRPFTTDIFVRAGETTPLNVSLTPE